MSYSQAAAMAEAMRQGQAETEMRMTMMGAMTGAVHQSNPLIDHFEGDREIARLSLDASINKGLITRSYFCNPMCFLPCFWPHQLLLCIPFGVCWQLGQVQKAADAHKLILREESLALIVDPYPSTMQSSKPTFKPCACCNSFDTLPIHQVVPLTEISSANVEPCLTKQCGGPVAPDTFVVRINGIDLPVFAVDVPVDGEAFAQQVMKQAEQAKGKSAAPLPPTWPEFRSKQFQPINPYGMMGGPGMMMPAGQQMGGQPYGQQMGGQPYGQQMGAPGQAGTFAGPSAVTSAVTSAPPAYNGDDVNAKV